MSSDHTGHYKFRIVVEVSASRSAWAYTFGLDDLSRTELDNDIRRYCVEAAKQNWVISAVTEEADGHVRVTSVGGTP